MNASIDIFQQIINAILDSFLSMLGTLFLYGVIGFIVSIVFIIFLAKSNLAVRKNRLWNIFAKLHYVVLFFSLTIIISLVGGVRSMQLLSNELLEKYLQPTVEQQVGNVQKVIISLWSDELHATNVSIQETSKKLAELIQYEPDEDEFFAEQKASMVNWLMEDVGQWVISITIATMLNKTIEATGEEVGVDARNLSFTVNEIKNIDFSKTGYKISKTVERVAQRYVNSIYTSQYISLLIMLCLILLLPLLEMLLYHLWWKKRNV